MAYMYLGGLYIHFKRTCRILCRASGINVGRHPTRGPVGRFLSSLFSSKVLLDQSADIKQTLSWSLVALYLLSGLICDARAVD